MLKETKEIISLPLSDLINNSLNQGVLTTAFKIAKVVPMFKSESRLICKNYRPSLLLSNISKIIETLMHRQLNDFLEQDRCLHRFQFGFLFNFSTNNGPKSIKENIQTLLDEVKVVAGVFVALKKNFDTADNDILMKKLENYGVRRITIDCLKSYLKGRKQFVVNKMESSSI